MIVASANLGLLAPDHLRVVEAALAETPARDRGARPTVALLGKGQIDEPVLRERRAQRHTEQAALPARADFRHTGQWRRQLAAPRDETQPARPLGDEHATVGKEHESPRMLEPARHVDLPAGEPTVL